MDGNVISFNLRDTSFAHLEYSAPGLKSDLMVWDRKLESNVTFDTHEQIFIEHPPVNYAAKNALLFESHAIIPHVYQRALECEDKMNGYVQIFTHSSALAKKYPDKVKWIPGGSIWVGGSYGGGEIKIYEKSRLCSMMASDKSMCYLHRLRSEIAMWLSEQRAADIYGTLLGDWVPVINSLADYMFSVCIENYVDDLYFTEKLLNCFATGTIPVYLGARNIHTVFNPDGILQFNTPGQLLDLLLTEVNEASYQKRIAAVHDNFERCQKYRLLEDYICQQYYAL